MIYDSLFGWLRHRVGNAPEPGWHLQLLDLEIQGRGLYFAVVAIGLVLLLGPVAHRLGGEIWTRWVTWALILPVVGIPIWTGQTATTALAILLAIGGVLEYSRLGGLAVPDTAWLFACGIVLPLATLGALHSPGGSVAGWVPWAVLGGAALPLLGSDSADGFRRGAMIAFAIVWICWSLANLSLLGRDAFPVLFAAACADVGAFVGGKGLRRYRWAAHPLTPLSPNKTWGGVAGGFMATAVILLVCGVLSIGWLIAVWLGGIAGDLLESMLKRQHGVKDAGSWLPGFGGLLDRIDSLLIAIPLAVLFS